MNEVQTQETIQYPAWQAKIREAQAEQVAEYIKWVEEHEGENLKRRLDNINRMREMLTEHGLHLPESTTGEWLLDGYTFQINPDHWSSDLVIWKPVPGADKALLEDADDTGLWRDGYRAQSRKVVEWRELTGVAIANALDTVDGDIADQIETNQRVIAQMEARKQQSQSSAQPKQLSVEERFAELIREIICEEMGVVRDSQWESLL